jgi:catechol 2,3-dioxygenase-like lactoylglutathione lyase family enzyme
MIGYATLGSNDLERARAFYSTLVAEIGGREVMRLDNGFTMYGTGRGQPTICITKPYNGKAAEPGNGNMVAIVVKERAQVDALHAKALALGGTDEGAPGVRGKEGPQAFYGAYFRDLDGNKLCALGRQAELDLEFLSTSEGSTTSGALRDSDEAVCHYAPTRRPIGRPALNGK